MRRGSSDTFWSTDLQFQEPLCVMPSSGFRRRNGNGYCKVLGPRGRRPPPGPGDNWLAFFPFTAASVIPAGQATFVWRRWVAGQARPIGVHCFGSRAQEEQEENMARTLSRIVLTVSVMLITAPG